MEWDPPRRYIGRDGQQKSIKRISVERKIETRQDVVLRQNFFTERKLLS